MDALNNLKYVLEKEIDNISKKNDISPTELERLDKAVDIIKDIETICAMKGYDYEMDDQGYFGRYPYYPRSMNGYSYGDQSYRRGRDAMGRYTSRDMMPQRYYDGGYSGHANKEDLKMDLRMMMDNSKSDQERMAIQKVLDMWKE